MRSRYAVAPLFGESIPADDSPGPGVLVPRTTTKSDLPSPLKSTFAFWVTVGAVVMVRFAAVTLPVSPAPRSRNLRVQVPLGVAAANAEFRLVTGGGFGAPPIPVTTVRLEL